MRYIPGKIRPFFQTSILLAKIDPFYAQYWKTIVLYLILEHSQMNDYKKTASLLRRSDKNGLAATRLKMGWRTGFEPATPGTTIRCSNQLSYSHHVLKVSYNPL